MRYNNYNEYKRAYNKRRAAVVTVWDVVKSGIFGAALAIALVW